MSTVDALTDQAMVVLQDRPVVPLSAWLNKALADCAETGRTLQLVTPLESRLTLPLRTAASGDGAQWIVRNGDGYYEGLTGRPMRWGGGTFVPVPEARDYAPGFTTRPTAPIGAQLTLVYRIRHAAEGDLAGTIERLLQLLTGKYPAGLGPAEPLEHPWRRDRLTEYVRGRSSVRLVVGGDGPRPAQAICDYSSGEGGAVAETSAQAAAVADRIGADSVAVLACPEMDGTALRRLAWQIERDDVELVVAPALMDVTGPRISIRPVAGLPLLHVEHPELDGVRKVLKGMFDRTAALAGLVLLSPLLAVVALMIKVTSAGPVMFRQVRVGRGGREFTVWKFRTMVRDA
ncbi:DUF6177 family protein, partial [Actinomadura geliboluensis]|uniref:DUF6177 family protein n=1 Tax=Actinomadura geliboluensis TaxID=882440 RepID=UPI001F10D7A7